MSLLAFPAIDQEIEYTHMCAQCCFQCAQNDRLQRHASQDTEHERRPRNGPLSRLPSASPKSLTHITLARRCRRLRSITCRLRARSRRCTRARHARYDRRARRRRISRARSRRLSPRSARLGPRRRYGLSLGRRRRQRPSGATTRQHRQEQTVDLPSRRNGRSVALDLGATLHAHVRRDLVGVHGGHEAGGDDAVCACYDLVEAVDLALV